MITIKTHMAAAFAAASLLLSALPAAADEAEQGADDNLLEEVFVLGKRRAYQGKPALAATNSESGVIRFMRPHSKPMNGRCENNYRAYWANLALIT